MRKKVILAAATVLSWTALTQAQQGDLDAKFTFSYWSKWLSKGAEAYGQQGALFKTIDLDLYDTGFGVNVTHRNATASGYVNMQRFDYRPYFKGVAFEDSPLTTKYNLSVGYEHYPGLDHKVSNTTFEWIYAFSWPELLKCGLVPSYIAHYEYPAGSGYKTQSGANVATGWVHRFLLGYDIDTSQLPNPLHLSSEMAYTDGLGGAEHDWSYATFGICTKFDITEDLYFKPHLYHQITMEDSVSTKKDITYCVLSMQYDF